MRSLAGLFGLKYAQEQRKDEMMVRSPGVEDRTGGARGKIGESMGRNTIVSLLLMRVLARFGLSKTRKLTTRGRNVGECLAVR